MLQEYRKHVEERAALGIVPAPLDAQQTADLIELIKTPPAGEEEFILELLINRVPPRVADAAYIKAGFLAAVAKGEAVSPLRLQNSRIVAINSTGNPKLRRNTTCNKKVASNN